MIIIRSEKARKDKNEKKINFAFEENYIMKERGRKM